MHPIESIIMCEWQAAGVADPLGSVAKDYRMYQN